MPKLTDMCLTENCTYCCREDECNCRGGYWRMKCAKADTVYIHTFYIVEKC